MQETFTKSFNVREKTIDVHFQHKVISIDCTGYSSKKDLSEIYQECKTLIHQFKENYRTNFKKDLKISDRSLIAEIWGHLVAYKIALWMKQTFKLSPLQKLAKFAANRSGTIDCGEAKVDSNRWIWDVMSWAFFRKY